ncbi:MAG TPA: L-fucose:H+ symporter permease [Flavihumibacter sp.]|jgi:FHS family L-fucose permease-like MFS transporter
MSSKNKYLLPFILVTSLFFLWAFLHNINPILIPHLKKACQLNDTQSALIDFAVYMAYFAVALPAGWFMNKYGFKKGIIFGLILYGLGALLFLPSADTRSYGLFLFALFVIAGGATFLETTANPYITKLGDPSTATQRLNFAQSFNGVGAFLAPLIGGKLIFSGIEHSEETLKAMEQSGTLQAYLQEEANSVRLPYLVIAIVVFVLVALFFMVKLPEGEERTGTANKEEDKFSFSVLSIPQVRWAVIAQFFYVGAQVGVGSFFIRFSKRAMDLPEIPASEYLSVSMIGFMAGRFIGTFLMKFIAPARLLVIYAAICVLLLCIASFGTGPVAVYALMGVPFFMSIMFPTIFAMGISGLGAAARMASSLLVMAIVGGAFFPLIMGQVSDLTGGNIQLAYVVPLICFAVVGLFGYTQSKRNLEVSVQAGH